MKQIINVKQVSLVLVIIFSALGLFSFYIIVGKVEVPGLELTTSDWKLLFAISAGMLIGLLVSQVLIPAIRSNSGESNGRDIEKEVRRQKKQTVTAYKKLEKTATKKKNALEHFTEKYTKLRTAIENGVAMAKEATAKIDALPYAEAIKQSKLYKVIEKVESAAPAQLKKLGELENKIKTTTAELAPLISEKEKLEPEVTLLTKKATQVNAVQQKPDLILFTQSDASGIAWASYKKILIPTGFAAPLLFLITILHEELGIEMTTSEVNIAMGVVIGIDIIFILSFLGFIFSTIKNWRKMKAVNHNNANKKESPSKIGFRRSWETFNTVIIISGALIPIFFGVVLAMLLFHTGDVGDYLAIPLLIIAGVFVLLWVIAFVAGIVFWRRASKQVVKKIVPFLNLDNKIISNAPFNKNNNTTLNNPLILYSSGDLATNIGNKILTKIMEKNPFLTKEILNGGKESCTIQDKFKNYINFTFTKKGWQLPTIPLGVGIECDPSDRGIFVLFMALATYYFIGAGTENAIDNICVFFYYKQKGSKAGNDAERNNIFDKDQIQPAEHPVNGKGQQKNADESKIMYYTTDAEDGEESGYYFNFKLDLVYLNNIVTALKKVESEKPFKLAIEKIGKTYYSISENAAIFLGLNVIYQFLGEYPLGGNMDKIVSLYNTKNIEVMTTPEEPDSTKIPDYKTDGGGQGSPNIIVEFKGNQTGAIGKVASRSKDAEIQIMPNVDSNNYDGVIISVTKSEKFKSLYMWVEIVSKPTTT